MYRLPQLIVFLLFVLVTSCKKEREITPESRNEPEVNPPPRNNNGQYRVYDAVSLIPLRNNGDGSWTGVFAGMEVRFADFMYEIIYDGLGNQVPPKTGDPCWPYSYGPEPGVTQPGVFNCLRFITSINSPNNQLSAQNTCQYSGSIYSPGAGLNSYFTTIDNNWNNYQNALLTYFANVASNPYYVFTPPRPPQTPLITPYLMQDFVYGPSQPLVFTARFGIIYDAATGAVSYGIDAR